MVLVSGRVRADLSRALVEGPVTQYHLIPRAAAAAYGAVHHLAHIVLIDGRRVDANLSVGGPVK